MNRLNEEQTRIWDKAFAYYCKTGRWLLNWESGMYGISSVPCDFNYFPENSMVIIKGSVIQPISVEIIKKYKIE